MGTDVAAIRTGVATHVDRLCTGPARAVNAYPMGALRARGSGRRSGGFRYRWRGWWLLRRVVVGRVRTVTRYRAGDSGGGGRQWRGIAKRPRLHHPRLRGELFRRSRRSCYRLSGLLSSSIHLLLLTVQCRLLLLKLCFPRTQAVLCLRLSIRLLRNGGGRSSGDGGSDGRGWWEYCRRGSLECWSTTTSK